MATARKSTASAQKTTRERAVQKRQDRGAREKLIRAAHSVIGRKGIDGSTIGEIVAEAGVGVGSFYNHFSTKEHLAREVFAEMTEELGTTVRDIVLAVPNPALATCFAYRALIQEAEDDPVWAAFIAQLEPSLQLLDALLRKYALVGLRLGIAEKQFDVDEPEIAVTLIHSMAVSMIQALVRKEVTSEQAHRSAAFALRMIGVPVEEANKLARLSFDRLLKLTGAKPVKVSLSGRHAE